MLKPFANKNSEQHGGFACSNVARLLHSLCLHLRPGIIPDKALGQLVLISTEVFLSNFIYLDFVVVVRKYYIRC